jgi:hypothetical protein
VILTTEVCRLGSINKNLRCVQIVNHRSVQRILACEVFHDAGRPVTHAVNVRNRSTVSGLVSKLQELAVEKDDVPDHQVCRITFNKRFQTASFSQVFGNRFLKQDLLSGFEQPPSDVDMRRRRAGNDPRFGVALRDGSINVGPTGHAWQQFIKLAQAFFAASNDASQFRLRQPSQSQRMQLSESPQADNSHSHRCEVLSRHDICSWCD